jgi:integral membrane protein (TIGR00529 family)
MMAGIPALVKVAFVFALALVAIRFKCSVGVALVLGALAMAPLFGLPPADLGKSLLHRLFSKETLELLAIVWLILGLSRAMQLGGQLDRIVHAFAQVLGGKRITVMALPALIGLLPMPGGAAFSAPMVESVLKTDEKSGDKKTAINYWFRHIWEYWWPMYPGVILAVSLTGAATWRFMLFQIPLTVVAVTSGYFFLLRDMRSSSTTEPSTESSGEDGESTSLKDEGKSRLFIEVFPIVLIISTLIVLSILSALSKGFEARMPLKNLPLIVSLLIGLVYVVVTNHLKRKQIEESLFPRSMLSMAVLVFGIMVFKGMLTDCGAVESLTLEMSEWGSPIIGVVILVPFISGIVTGIAVGFVGASFPLVVSLVEGAGLESQMAAYTILAYGFGYMGMMLSPVHVCLVLTRQYWNAPFGRVVRRIAGPCLCIMAASAVLFFVYSRLA